MNNYWTTSKIENTQQNNWKTNGSRQDSIFVTDLQEIGWMTWDLRSEKPFENQH